MALDNMYYSNYSRYLSINYTILEQLLKEKLKNCIVKWDCNQQLHAQMYSVIRETYVIFISTLIHLFGCVIIELTMYRYPWVKLENINTL